MTNNENIKLIRELYDYAMWDFHKGNLDEMTNKDVAVGKAIDNVEKDLEVLEILKKNVKIVDYGEREIFGGELYILQGFRITNREDYQKIKEWIENDK